MPYSEVQDQYQCSDSATFRVRIFTFWRLLMAIYTVIFASLLCTSCFFVTRGFENIDKFLASLLISKKMSNIFLRNKDTSRLDSPLHSHQNRKPWRFPWEVFKKCLVRFLWLTNQRAQYAFLFTYECTSTGQLERSCNNLFANVGYILTMSHCWRNSK